MSITLHPLVLFCQARSGSSNLLRVLQLHPGLRIAEEPFHEKYHEWNPGEPSYVDLVVDVRTLEEQLAALFARYDGIKVLDYQLPAELYTHLLLRPARKVIALRRRNALQQAVSGFIAEQTGIWKMWDLQGDLATSYRRLQPIDLVALEQNLAYRAELDRYYSGILAQKPPEMRLLLEYEALYTPDVARNRESMRRVFHFLGLAMPEGRELDDLIDPRVSKINNVDTYAFLPNAQMIDERFGSDERGWLFEKR